jgi:hypothetical protein
MWRNEKSITSNGAPSDLKLAPLSKPRYLRWQPKNRNGSQRNANHRRSDLGLRTSALRALLVSRGCSVR